MTPQEFYLWYELVGSKTWAPFVSKWACDWAGGGETKPDRQGTDRKSQGHSEAPDIAKFAKNSTDHKTWNSGSHEYAPREARTPDLEVNSLTL